MRPQDCFMPLQKPIAKSLGDSFKLLLNPGTIGPRDSFKQIQKQTKMILQIISNHFKNQTQGFPRFFQTNSKTRHKNPEILSNYFKNQALRRSRDSFKLLQ